MANIVYSLTRLQIRQAIAKMISSISSYVIFTAPVSAATSGSTTGTISVPKLRAVPQTDTSLHVGSLLYVVSGTGSSSQPYYITAFAPGILTVTPSWTNGTPDSTSTIEIYPSGKWSKDEIENAIDLAFWDGASRLLWPTEEVAVAFESSNPTSLTGPTPSLVPNNFRNEYPIPSQFSWLTALDYDQNNPVAGYGPNAFDFTHTDAYFDEAGVVVGGLNPMQSFTVAGPTEVSAVALYLSRSSLSPMTEADGVRVTIGTTVSGTSTGIDGEGYQPFNTASSADGTLYPSFIRLMEDIPTRPAMIVFEFPHPMLLQAGVTYWLELGYINNDGTYPAQVTTAPSGRVQWGTDSAGRFGKPTGYNTPALQAVDNKGRAFYTSTGWGSFIFYLYSDPQFRPIPPNAWSIVTGDDQELIHFDTAVIGQPADGTLIRLRGARPANAFDQTAATDTSVPEVEPTFLIYKAASILAIARAPEPGMTVDALQAKADLWGKQSEQHRQPFSIPPGAARKVR